MNVHSFAESLAKSAAQADAPWWEPLYRDAFPNFATMSCVRSDGWAQRGGIDRVITLASGKTVTVDEKVRERDWPDILWEFWSDRDKKTPGWVVKDLACDFIAYAFVPSRTCYLLPALQVRRAWRLHGPSWVQKARENARGFRLVEADNGRYVTVSVAVPVAETLRAITDAMVARWN